MQAVFDCGVTLIFILASCSPVLDKLPHCLFAGRPTSTHRLRTDRIIIYWSKNFVISQSAMEYIGWYWKVPDYDSDSVLKCVLCSHDLWRNWKLALFQFNRCLQMKISSNWNWRDFLFIAMLHLKERWFDKRVRTSCLVAIPASPSPPYRHRLAHYH